MRGSTSPGDFKLRANEIDAALGASEAGCALDMGRSVTSLRPPPICKRKRQVSIISPLSIEAAQQMPLWHQPQLFTFREPMGSPAATVWRDRRFGRVPGTLGLLPCCLFPAARVLTWESTLSSLTITRAPLQLSSACPRTLASRTRRAYAPPRYESLAGE